MHPAPSASNPILRPLRTHEACSQPLRALSHGLVQLSAGPLHHTAAVQQCSSAASNRSLVLEPRAGVIARRRARSPLGPSAVRARRDIRLAILVSSRASRGPHTSLPLRPNKPIRYIASGSLGRPACTTQGTFALPPLIHPAAYRLPPARPASLGVALRVTPAARAWRLYSTAAIAMGVRSRALRSAPSNHSPS